MWSISISTAQQVHFNACTQDKIIQFIDAGLTKGEIVKLCSSSENSPSAGKLKSKPRIKEVAQTDRKIRGNLTVLNGNWLMETVCEPYSGSGENFIIKDGKITGNIYGGEDALYVTGTVEKDGSINAYGTGNYVAGELTGKIIDWRNCKGTGTIIGTGEIHCNGSWKFTKKK